MKLNKGFVFLKQLSLSMRISVMTVESVTTVQVAVVVIVVVRR